MAWHDDCAGGANRHTPVAEHKTLVGMRNNQFRSANARWVWLAQLEDAGLAENLAVTATVAKLWLDGRIPRNLLPRSEQPLPLFRRIRLV